MNTNYLERHRRRSNIIMDHQDSTGSSELEEDGDGGTLVMSPPWNPMSSENTTNWHSRQPFRQSRGPKLEQVESSITLDKTAPGLSFVERNFEDLNLGYTKPKTQQWQDNQAMEELEQTTKFLLQVHQFMENLYEQDDEGDTMLHHAVIQRQTQEFSNILQKTFIQAYLEIVNRYGQTPLHLAIALNHLDMARKLLVCGANLTAQDIKGRTPLHMACEKGDLTAVRTLTEPLSSKECNTETTELKYEPEHSVMPQNSNIVNFEGEPCVYVAGKQKSLSIISHLVDKCGHNINAQEQKGGKTLLHMAVETEDEPLLRYLLGHPETDPHMCDYSGRSPLQHSKYHTLSREVICSIYPHLRYDLKDLYDMESSSSEDDLDYGMQLSAGD